jgi:hypothetical protein
LRKDTSRKVGRGSRRTSSEETARDLTVRAWRFGKGDHALCGYGLDRDDESAKIVKIEKLVEASDGRCEPELITCFLATDGWGSAGHRGKMRLMLRVVDNWQLLGLAMELRAVQGPLNAEAATDRGFGRW